MSGKKSASLVLFILFLLFVVFAGYVFLNFLPWLPFMIAAIGSGPAKDPIPDRGSFYTYTASYLVDQVEPLSFNFIVGCTDYDFKFPGDRQGMLPGAYAKQTSQGHVVMIVVQELCRSSRQSALDSLDGTFLPLVIWFESASELELGLGYSTIEAYESPASRLTFLGASVRAATQEEFLEWYPSRNENLLTNDMLESRNFRADESWFTEPQPVLPVSCYSVGFAHAGPKAQELIAQYWPEDHPRYWSRADIEQEQYNELNNRLSFGRGIELFAHTSSDLTGKDEKNMVNWAQEPTTSQSNLNISKHIGGKYPLTPTEKYPLYYSDAISILRQGKAAPELNFEIDKRFQMKGFSACYRRYGWSSKPDAKSITEFEKRIFNGAGEIGIESDLKDGVLKNHPRSPMDWPSREFIIENKTISREEIESFPSQIVK